MLGTLGLVLGTIAFLAYYLIKTISRKSEEYWKKNGVNTVLKNKLTLYDLLTGKKSMVDFDNEYYLELGNEKYGGLNEMGTKSLVVKDLEIAKQILIKDFEYFTDRRDIGKSDPLFSSSLLFMQGHEWKDMRSFLSPTFSSGKIRRMFEQFQASGEKLVQYVMAQYPKRVDGYDVLIGDVVRRYTVDVIGSVAFGMDTGALKDPNSIFLKMANKSSKVDAPRMIRTAIMIVFPRLAEFLGLSILDKQILHFFSPILKSAVKGRESSGEKRNDFLQLLLEAKAGELKDDDEVEGSANLGNEKKSKVELTDAGILSQAFLFFFAGFETVTNLLHSATYVLAAHQDVQDRVYEEIMAVTERNLGQISYESVNEMTYLDMVLAEIMRRYSPGSRTERKCVKDYQLPGTDLVIPKDSMVIFPIGGIHMDEKYYPDPEKFDPERFSQENKAKRDSLTYLPFGNGPRNCIGMRFALIEAKTAIAHLLKSFVLKPSDTTPIPVKFHSKMGMYRAPTELEIRLKPRNC